MSTARHVQKGDQTFLIDHPFHPRQGERHTLAYTHRSWAEDRLYFRGEDGRLWSVDRALTDWRDPDPFVEFSAGRAHCRVDDLDGLALLIAALVNDSEVVNV